MRLRTVACSTLSLVIAFFVTAPAFAQIPCGPTISPPPTLSVNWPQYGYNPAHSGCNPYERVLNTSNVSNLVLDWDFYPGVTIQSSPAVVNGVVYIGADDGNLYALNASTGTVIWKSGIGASVDTSPAVVDGRVYVGASVDFSAGLVDAVNATTGAVLWAYPTGGEINSSPTVANGVVYVGSNDTYLYALDAGTGALLWKNAIGQVWSSPAVANGVVYVGSDDNNLYAFDAHTGALVWNYTTGGPVHSSPAVLNHLVYFGSGDGNIYAVDAASGVLKWKYTTGGPSIDSMPAVANNRVYIAAGDQYLYALNATTGALLWRNYELALASPSVANGVVYSSDFGFDAVTGTLLWEYIFHSEARNSAVVVNGKVYLGVVLYDNRQVFGHVWAFHLQGQ